jgi:GDSL-like Lipase/Acylhydrolase
MQRHLRYFIFLFVLFASSAAFGEVRFQQTVAFGDSLTHNDLLWVQSGLPRRMYGADPMEAVFDKGAQPGDDLKSFAVAGSESDELDLEIDAYFFLMAVGQLEKATLFNLEIGGNDILNNINSLAAHPPGESGPADAIIDNLISNIRRGYRRLRNVQPNTQMIIWTVPDVTLTPDQFSELTAEEAANVRAHIRRANRFIERLGRFRRTVVFDLYRLLQAYVRNPPTIYGHQLVPPPAYGHFDHLFADWLHPSAVSNALIANSIIKVINSRWRDDIPRYTRRQLARLAHIQR